MRRPGRWLRRPVRWDGRSVASIVSSFLLVVIVFVLVTVVAIFVFTMVQRPDDPPDIRVNYTVLNDRWSISITGAEEKVKAIDLRVTVRDTRGEYVQYDSDADGVADEILVKTVDEIAVTSGDGPQPAPIIFLDANGDGKLGVGDSLVAYSLYYNPSGPCMDVDRGYAYVGPPPHGIPRGSTLQLVASPVTLGSNDINPGDVINVTIKHGAMTLTSASGFASFGGVMVKKVEIGAGWSTGMYDAIFVIRPGEADEWVYTHSFMVENSSPITPTEEAQYYAVCHPLVEGCVVTVFHRPSASVILEFTL